MLNVLKYDHLCESLTFNGYLYEICSMCENMTFIGYLCETCSMCEHMAIDVLVLFLKCVQFSKSCVQFLVETTESGNSSVSDEEKGRHAHATHVSYLSRRETHPRNTHLLSKEKGDASTKWVSHIYLTCTKKCLQNILQGMLHATCPLANIREYMCANGHPTGLAQEALHGALAI
jgi:hypothetical protein